MVARRYEEGAKRGKGVGICLDARVTAPDQLRQFGVVVDLENKRCCGDHLYELTLCETAANARGIGEALGQDHK